MIKMHVARELIYDPLFSDRWPVCLAAIVKALGATSSDLYETAGSHEVVVFEIPGAPEGADEVSVALSTSTGDFTEPEHLSVAGLDWMHDGVRLDPQPVGWRPAPPPPCDTCRGMVAGQCPACGRVKEPTTAEDAPGWAPRPRAWLEQRPGVERLPVAELARLTVCTVCGDCVHDHTGWSHAFTNEPRAAVTPDAERAIQRTKDRMRGSSDDH